MAYDVVHHVVLMYGGATDLDIGAGCGEASPLVQCYQDTWTWDGTDWKQQHPSQTPGLWGTITFDESANSVLFYGDDGNTWRWSGTDWTKVGSPQKPQPAAHQALMAFDPATRGVIQFGGIDLSGSVARTQMWRWNGNAWIALSPPAPNVPVWGSMCGDAARKVLIAYAPSYGGTTASSVRPPSNTWEWDGAAWTQLEPAHEPDLFWTQMFGDPLQGRLLLVGTDGTALSIRIWAWNGTDWNAADA